MANYAWGNHLAIATVLSIAFTPQQIKRFVTASFGFLTVTETGHLDSKQTRPLAKSALIVIQVNIFQIL